MTTKPTFGDVRSALHASKPLPMGWRDLPEAVEYLTPDAGTLKLTIPDILKDGPITQPFTLEACIKGKPVVFERWVGVWAWRIFRALCSEIKDLKDHARPSHRMINLGAPLRDDPDNPMLQGNLTALCDDRFTPTSLTDHYRSSHFEWRSSCYMAVARLSPDPVIAIRAWLSAQASQRFARHGELAALDRLVHAEYGQAQAVAGRPPRPMFGQPHSAHHRIPVGLRHLPRELTLEEQASTMWEVAQREVVMWSKRQDPVGHSVSALIVDYLIAALGYVAKHTLPEAWRRTCALEVIP
jgi:hypothetical protein